MNSASSGHTMPPRHNDGTAWRSFLLITLAVVSAVWVTGSPRWFSTWCGFPNTALTTLILLVAVSATRSSVPAGYRWSIVAGLGWSALGDAFLMSSRDYFLAGLASFLVAHVCYLWALTRDSQLAGYKAPFISWGLFGIVLVFKLWPGLAPSLRIPVIVYAIALLAMAAQAASRALTRRSPGATLAALGAALFVISDSVLAYQRFLHPLEWGRMIVLGTYFAAQGGLAFSVMVYRK